MAARARFNHDFPSARASTKDRSGSRVAGRGAERSITCLFERHLSHISHLQNSHINQGRRTLLPHRIPVSIPSDQIFPDSSTQSENWTQNPQCRGPRSTVPELPDISPFQVLFPCGGGRIINRKQTQLYWVVVHSA